MTRRMLYITFYKKQLNLLETNIKELKNFYKYNPSTNVLLAIRLRMSERDAVKHRIHNMLKISECVYNTHKRQRC